MYDNIKKALCKELEQMDKDMENNSKMSDGDLRRYDTIMHALKSEATWEAMEGQSYGNMSYDGGASYRRGRDSMGRYTSRMEQPDPQGGEFGYPFPQSYGPGGRYPRW
jgi:hypothetical protein